VALAVDDHKRQVHIEPVSPRQHLTLGRREQRMHFVLEAPDILVRRPRSQSGCSVSPVGAARPPRLPR